MTNNIFTKKTNVFITFILTLLFQSNALATDMKTSDIVQGYIKHATKAQLYRWYQLYENQNTTIENALDILDPNVIVNSSLGVANGHEDYSKRVSKIPKTWKNAHDVKKVNIDVAEDGNIDMTVNIVYSNQGMLPDNNIRTAELTYTTSLKSTDSVLPKFGQIKIGPNPDAKEAPKVDKFEDLYPKNRILSLVHYWLAIIEDPKRNPEPAHDILANGFSLNFSSGTITDFAGFKKWLLGPASQVKASTHIISDFSYEPIDDFSYKATMTFDWNGILPNDKEMTAKTKHTWTVIDNPKERFARIQNIDVEIIKPFALKTQ